MSKIPQHQIIFLTFSLILLATLPVMASLGNVWTDFQFYALDLQNYLKAQIPDTLKPLEVQTQTAITNSTASLKIPNPNAVGNTVSQQITQYSISDKFENNSAVRGKMVRNEIARQITRGSVDGVLGRNGQARLSIDLQNTQKAVDDTAVFANNAAANKNKKQIEIEQQVLGAGNILGGLANATFSPSILASLQSNQAQLAKLTWEGLSDLELQNINIEREQSRIMGETLGNTIQMHEALQYSNLNLANISQEMDEVNRGKRVDTSAEVARLLRATSQTDLLGRKR
jgi:hypothetical protein